MYKVYNRILSVAGNVIMVSAEGIRYNDLAEVTMQDGKSLAQVIRLDGDKVYLQVFAGGRGVATNDQVRFLGHPMQVSFSDNLG